jgi:hypothetical protein
MINKVLKTILIMFIMISIVFCGSDTSDDKDGDTESNQQDQTSDHDETADDKEQTGDDVNETKDDEDSPDYNQMDFFEGAEVITNDFMEYFNSFSEETAPSGLELTTRTIELTSFLNAQGRARREVIKTDTYKSLFQLLTQMEEILKQNEEVLKPTSRVSPREYISFYHKRLDQINAKIAEIKDNIENRK